MVKKLEKISANWWQKNKKKLKLNRLISWK